MKRKYKRRTSRFGIFFVFLWRNVDLENNTFDVTEQLPFKVPPKTKVIEEMAPPKSNGRKLPITELARPFFLKQLAINSEKL